MLFHSITHRPLFLSAAAVVYVLLCAPRNRSGQRDFSSSRSSSTPVPRRRTCRCCSHPSGLERVDELFDYNPCGHTTNERQKGLAQSLMPRRNAAKLFEAVKKLFHLLAQLVELFIIATQWRKHTSKYEFVNTL